MSPKKRRKEDAWYDDVESGPRADLPNERALLKTRLMRTYVWFATLALPMLLVFNLVIGSQIVLDDGPEIEAPEAQDTTPATTEARALALSTVGEWLDNEPAPLPGGRIVSWNYATDVVDVAPEVEDTDGEPIPWDRLQMHDVTVTDTAGSFYSARVSMAIDPIEGVQLASGVSLTPYAPPTNRNYAGDFLPGAQSVSVSDQVDSAVEEWAEAFTGEDPARLRLAVGDPNSDHSYMPLAGAELIGTSLGHVTVQADQIDEEGRPPSDPDLVVGRADLRVLWPGQEEPEDDDAFPVLTYDLLIEGASTASPRVVAWGGPGTGGELEPYANAVVGRELTVTTPEGEEVEPPEDGENGEEGDPDLPEPTGDEDEDEED